MRAYQTTGDVATCAGAAPASGASGWFRYATANHSSAGEFNRWHAMDVQRFALVPLPAAQGGPAAGAPTFWDTDWGTCLNDNEWMDCEASPAATRATVAVAPGATKITQEGAPDQALIAIPAPARATSWPTAATRSSPSPTRTGRCRSRAPATEVSTARRSTSPAPRATATSP